MKLTFKNIVICNPGQKHKKGKVSLENSKFTGTHKGKNELDFSGYTVYPGLVNAHDHLLGTYFPRVGNGPYLNWRPWDEDLKNSKLYQERGKISPQDLYLLGYYRQILSGVTTVSDHIPHKVNKNFIKNAYINVVKKYTLAHEVSSYDLKWGNSLSGEIKKAREKNIPFITHIEEGYDREAVNGIPFLQKHKGLFKNTVLVHCISCSKKDIKAIARHKASMVWCPFSNYYMFGETADIKTFINQGVNVTLGTDSPMSGGVHLLAEMKTAVKLYKQMYKKQLNPALVFDMVTLNGARAYKLDQEIGSIKAGKSADFVILKNRAHTDPYTNLLQADLPDIEMVFRKGKPLYFKERYKESFNVNLKNYQKIMLKNKEKYFLIGKPLTLQKRINKKVGFKKYLDFFPVS
ncbi:MAG TPA: amidohydrolase family protein [Spirochaetota bacterium]|nr:amidohydrolase family protein [Spirochaetota bacterium]